MKLVTFSAPQGPRVGAVVDDGIVDLSAIAPSMLALVAGGTAAREAVARAVQQRASVLPLDTVLLAPIPRPARNIFCVGKNYHEHAKEFHNSGFDASAAGASAIPDLPIVFTKAPSSVIATGQPIPGHLDPTDSVDYEGELGVVIGIGGRGIEKADAMRHVWGYTIINDVTARKLQSRHKQWFLGKSIDGFCPMGPLLVTADEVGDPTKLRLTTKVNGELRQDAVVADLIFDIPTLIETISAGITLEVGDIIATGTPAGVGIGFDPPKFLKKGDTVVVAIDKLGELSNPVA
jgi:2-keto-4-pentenoate hydratase/2-oxohepta-3-ene-1,7-dioic acid hydratase in catechol pathway